MPALQFALAIIFPGADVSDIVAAATKNSVHILDKQNYDASKDYVTVINTYKPYMNGNRIMLLFVFANSYSILASNEYRLTEAITKSREFCN